MQRCKKVFNQPFEGRGTGTGGFSGPAPDICNRRRKGRTSRTGRSPHFSGSSAATYYLPHTLFLLALAIKGPFQYQKRQLSGHKCEERCRWQLVHAQHHARKTEVAELHGEPQAIGHTPVLLNQREVGLTEGVLPDELLGAFKQRQELLPLRYR